MHVVLLALDGNLPSGLVGLADVFWLAGKASESQPKARRWPLCDVIVASPDGRAVTDGRGRRLAVDAALKDIPRADAVLIPGLMPASDGLPPQNAQTAKAAAWLRQQHAHGAYICGSCAGVFVLGEAGLLNRWRRAFMCRQATCKRTTLFFWQPRRPCAVTGATRPLLRMHWPLSSLPASAPCTGA